MSPLPFKIYIAGPDVFMPDPVERGEQLKSIVRSFGYTPLFPLDNEIIQSEDLSKDIFTGNVKMIQQADIIIANLNAFRGHEPDSGTVWEIGYAHALNKRIIGYTNDIRPMKTKINPGTNSIHDKNGWRIEDFGHPNNLMIANACEAIIEGDISNALSYIQNRAQENPFT